MNYNAFMDQMLGMGKWSQSVYRSGQLNQEQKEKLRNAIFGFRERAEKEEITLWKSIEISRKILETYIHEYSDPRAIPDFFMEHLDDVKQLVQSVDQERRKSDSPYAEYDFEEILHVLSDRFIRTASKILRISFKEKAPPMQLPSPSDLYVPKQDNSLAAAFKPK